MSPVARLLVAAIKGYKRFLSPLLPPACRFEPTCSVYAADAVSAWGARRGAWLAVKRILRCRPGGGSGFDPVPPRE